MERGLTQASKSSGVTRPSETAASFRVVPSACAFLADPRCIVVADVGVECRHEHERALRHLLDAGPVRSRCRRCSDP